MPAGAICPSLGFPRSRVWFPVGVAEALAAMPAWNKVLRAQLRPAGVPLWRRQRVCGGGSPVVGSLYRSLRLELLRLLRWGDDELAGLLMQFSAKGGAGVGSAVCGLVDLGVSSIFWWRISDPGPWRRHGVRPRPMGYNGGRLLVFSGEMLLRLLSKLSSNGAFRGPWVRPSFSVRLRRRLLRLRSPAAVNVGEFGKQSGLKGLCCNFSCSRGFSASLVGVGVLYILCVCPGLYGVFVRFP